MRIQVLGPICASLDGNLLDLGPTRRRAVLGLLALAGGQPLTRAELIDALWPSRPPSSAVNVIQTHVKHLRRLLEPDRKARTRSTILPSVGDGYALRVPDGAVDVVRFRKLVASAAEALRGGDARRAAALLGESLALWRGSPLCDVAFLAGHPKVVSLAGERQTALARHSEVMIAIGAAGETVAALEEAAAAEPLNEAIQALLIQAYLAVGQRSRAFATYHDTRDRLAEELGVDPGAELSAIYPALLDAGGVSAAGGTGPVIAAGRPVPAQLPADVPDFTGRAGELDELDGLPAARQRQPTAPAVVVISGTAGVGKTALAVHWAQRARDRFPDGQLYVDLRGYDSDRPIPAGDALTSFLTALGVPAREVPLDLDDRAARFRTEVAGRRLLIVLDNAGAVEQVRPLLPGTPSCVVLVTSRDSLAGLVARHGARRVNLDLLPIADAVRLLHTLVGGAVEADPASAATLAGQCARLPLALRVAAELAVTRGATLREMVAGFADRQGRLDQLDTGPDRQTAIRAVFSWSYQHLPADVARAFRLLSLHPGAELDSYVAAALCHTTLGPAARLLEVLARAHLLARIGPDRYGMHDLLRAYAGQQCLATDAEPDRRAALTRLFDYFLATAALAVDALEPAELHHRPRIGLPGVPVPSLPDAAAGRAWLDAERATLVAISGYAVHDWPGYARRLAATLYRYLDGGHLTDALTIYTHAADAARRAGDRCGEAHALTNLGSIYRLSGRYPTATVHYRRAFALHRRAGDRRGEARALVHLGILYSRLGRYESARRCQRHALILHRGAGDRAGEARALTNLGIVEERLGRYEQAGRHHRQAIDCYREVGDRICEAASLSRLCVIDARLGRVGPATDYHQRALAMYRDIGHRRGEAHVLTNLGELDTLNGRYGPAVRHHNAALALFREIGDRYSEASTLNGLGEAMWLSGRAGAALAHHSAALAIVVETEDQDEQARAHCGLARVRQADGEIDQARGHWERALTLYIGLGVPEADAARAGLAALELSHQQVG